GTIWIVIGVGMLIAFGALFYLVAIRPGLTESGLRLGMWLLLGGVLAGGLIWAGTQTVRGAAHSILVNGVRARLLAARIAWLGMVFVLLAPLFGFVVIATTFIGMVTAGVVALGSAKDYQAWRDAQEEARAVTPQRIRR